MLRSLVGSEMCIRDRHKISPLLLSLTTDASVVRDSRRGDILCRVIVETPSSLNRKQLKLLNQFTSSLDENNYPGTDSFNKISSNLND